LSRRRTIAAYGLSGGMRTLLSLAMALAQQPRLLLLDESSLGLSGYALERWRSIIRDLAARGGSVLMVEHRPNVIKNLVDYEYYLIDGQFAVAGPPDEVHRSRAFVEDFLGQNGSGVHKNAKEANTQ
jgi:ABC-type branched-subunit amino acid transport system ATPase component